jgi:hypothetical protein
MVDRPRLALGKDNELFMLWSQNTLPIGPGPLALYFSRSIDGGLTWSQAELVVDQPPAWSEILANPEGIVHRMWQEVTSGGITVWHDLSTADGENWSRTSPVSIFGDTSTISSLVSDPSQRLNLVQVVGRGAGNFSIQHWVWDNAGWQNNRNLDFTLEPSSLIQSAISGVSPTGELVVLFSGQSINPDLGEREGILYFTHRTLDIPIIDPAQQRTITPESSPTPTETTVPTETPVPTALPTQTSGARTPGINAQVVDDGPQNSWNGLIISGVLVLAVIVAAIGFRLYSLRQSRR